MSEPELTPRQQLVSMYLADRPLAHAVLFRHRHPQASPPFHRQMIEDWHSSAPFVLDMVFREGGKSTIAEEAITLMALFREFKNGLIVGSSGPKAIERLHAIKHELENNEDIRRIFGDMVGPTWTDDEVILANGTRIVARGKGQSLRGTKFEDQRPDMIFVDDMEEDLADVSTPEARRKTLLWFTSVLLPAGDSLKKRVRMSATPLHPEAVPVLLLKDPEWIHHQFPLYYRDEEGEKVSSWPERWPIDKILKLEQGYYARGQVDVFQREYMVTAEAPDSKPFRAEMIRVEPRVRTWQAVYSMTDPARTTRSTSATTGRVVWSWIGPKLVIWDGIARRWMPNEIIDDLFHIQETYHPVHIGFEEDGLNQWALQAIRQEMVKRGTTIPLRATKAPPSKINFIRGLQPFFQAREVEFAQPLPDLKGQLLGFPTGDIDAPNALAYALKMRPGAPLYDDFGGRHVTEDLDAAPGRPVWLCLNATRACVTGVLVQAFDGHVRILADATREGDPSEVARDLITTLRLETASRDIRITAGPVHFDQYNNVGLRQAIARIPLDVRPSVPCDQGRPHMRGLLQSERQAMPAFLVSDKATWTLNALSGGYCRVLNKGGILADHAEEGVYRTLMEGLESFLGLMDLGLGDGDDRASLNAETAQGRPYRSMLGGATTVRETKGDWNAVLRGGR